MQNEALQRFSEFGAGMAATRSPNFFTMLGGGARAQAEGDRTRMEELRRVAEAERQARAQQAEEQFRNQQLEIERQRRTLDERRIDAEIARGNRVTPTVIGTETGTGFAVVADPTAPGGTRVLQGVTPVQITNAANRAEAARDALAVRAGNAAVATAQRTSLTPLSEQQIESIFQDAYRRSLNPTQSGGGGGGGAGGPAARIDALGNPIR
jgi:hypothetical protein